MRFYIYLNENKTLKWSDHISGNRELKTALDLMKTINQKGYECLIVGGFVRDILLGLKSNDIDLCTNMPQKEIENHFDTFDIGKNKQFGVSVVKYKGFEFEIAQYRSDIYNSLEGSRGAEQVELASDFKKDASRRDFTINSLGINYKGEIIDHNNGTNDIDNKVIAAVGDPKLRFTEDVIRMMRGVRAAAKLDFEIEDKTKETMRKMADQIWLASPERIKSELVKMASQSGEKFAKAIMILDDVGVLEIILPEIAKLKEYKETPEFHPEAYEYGEGRVYDHVLAALRMNKLEDPIVNLAILFHDIGKGTTHQKIDGKHTFRNHAEQAKNLIDRIANRLKFSTKEKNSIMFAAVNHMKMHRAMEMKPTKILKLVQDENWEVLKAVSYADDASRLGLFDKKRFNSIIDNMEKISKKWGDKVVNNATKIIDGKMVMKVLNIKPGPVIGQIIQKVTDYVINTGSKEKLEDLIKKAYNEIQ